MRVCILLTSPLCRSRSGQKKYTKWVFEKSTLLNKIVEFQKFFLCFVETVSFTTFCLERRNLLNSSFASCMRQSDVVGAPGGRCEPWWDGPTSRTVGSSESHDGDLVLPRDRYQEFTDDVKYREMNHSVVVIGAVRDLTALRITKDPHKVPTGVVVSMKQVMHQFGSTSGNVIHLTKHREHFRSRLWWLCPSVFPPCTPWG